MAFSEKPGTIDPGEPRGRAMDSNLAACIVESQAKQAIRDLAGFASDDEAIRVAADIVCGRGRFSGLDGESLAEEIIGSRRRALRAVVATAAGTEIAAR